MTSQITKDFQMKSKLRKLADGGSPSPSMLGTGAAARAGGLLAGRGRQIDDAVNAATGAPVPAPAPAPAPAPKQVAQAPKKSGLRSMFGFADGGSLRPEDITGGTATSIFTPGEMKQFNAMGSEALASGNAEAAQAVGAGRAEAAQAAAAAAKEAAQFRGFADGGSYLGDGYNANRYQQSQLRDGGRVNGPGGRTDDKVGPVMLSDEEYVLPGDTADAIGRDKLDAMRLATHDFKDGRKESALRGRTDDVPIDRLADGGNPWIVDSKGTVRPNAFGDAAAGPGYTQPRLPPPQPGTAVQVAQPPMGQRPPINMGPVDEVPRQSPLRPAAPVATPEAAPQGRAYRVGKAVGGAAYTAGRVGGGLAVTAPLAGFGDYKADTGGVDTSAAGTLGYLAKGEFGNVGTSLSGGLGEALADSGRGLAKTADWAAGLVGAKPDLTGSYDKMITDKLGGYLSLRNPESNSGEIMGPPESAKGPVGAATSALRSDQGPAQPVTPGSYQSRRLSEMGVPLDVQNSPPVVDSAQNNTREILRSGGTDKFQNLGTYGGNANIYGRSSTGNGRINEFVGVGAGASPSNEASGSGFNSAITSALRGLGSGPSSPGGSGGNSSPVDNSAAINARYDKLAKDLSGMYGPKGQGNLARRLLELESSRSNALDADARNVTSRSNAAMQNSTLRDNAQLSARTSMIDTLGRMEQNRSTTSAQAQAAQLKALEDAQKIAREGEEKGFGRYTGAIGQMFTVKDKDGKQTVDKAAQERFRSFIEGSDPQASKKFAQMGPQEQQVLLQNFKTLFDMNEVRNKTAQSGSWPSNAGGVTNRMDMPTDVREATWNDYWNNNLPLKDYLWSNVPGTNRNVVVTESGQPTLYSDYTTTDGKRDLDKEKIVRDSVNARRSALRSN